jgi:hypothetical protein
MHGNAHVRFRWAGAGKGAEVVTRPPRHLSDPTSVQSTGKGANLFSQFVSRRYERGPIIITSNQRLGAWGDAFIWRPGGGTVRNFPRYDVVGKGW